MSTSSMSWSSRTGSCVSTSLTWLTWLDIFLEWRDLPYLTWLIWLESFDLTWFALPTCSSSCVYIHISRRICDGESSSGTPSSGVIRSALRENGLVIFGLCSIQLRRHGPLISCHVLLPRCFALSGTTWGLVSSRFPFWKRMCFWASLRFGGQKVQSLKSVSDNYA